MIGESDEGGTCKASRRSERSRRRVVDREYS